MTVSTTSRPRAPSDDRRWRIVETRMRRLGQRPDALIEVLHAAQEAFGFLDSEALAFIGASLGVPLSKVYGVATLAALVVLVDAAIGGEPGSIMLRRVRPRRPAPASWSHHLDPESLAGLAEALYGVVPPVVLVEVAAASVAPGGNLSPPLERLVPEVMQVVIRVAGR